MATEVTAWADSDGRIWDTEAKARRSDLVLALESVITSPRARKIAEAIVKDYAGIHAVITANPPPSP